jgi:hypothetical protein
VNSEGLALPGVRVTATSIPGSVTREARTDNRGAYQIVFPDGTGDYIMGFALIGYVYRQHQLKRLADEDVLLANTVLDVIPLDTVAVVASVQQRVNRNSRTPDVGGTERFIDPTDLTPGEQGDIAAMAASLPGVLLVPGAEGDPAGFSVFGLDPSQNLLTLNGLPIGPDGLPRDATIGASMSTSSGRTAPGARSAASTRPYPPADAWLAHSCTTRRSTTPRGSWDARRATTPRCSTATRWRSRPRGWLPTPSIAWSASSRRAASRASSVPTVLNG